MAAAVIPFEVALAHAPFSGGPSPRGWCNLCGCARTCDQLAIEPPVSSRERATVRTGNPLSSARDRNCVNANRRARPASGIKMPAHMPSAPGVSHASRAHRHRRGQPRQIALAPSSACTVHRSGSRMHAPTGISPNTSAITSPRGVAAVGPLWSCKSVGPRNHSTIHLYRCLTIQMYCRPCRFPTRP
jgi:hypothetical protein